MMFIHGNNARFTLPGHPLRTSYFTQYAGNVNNNPHSGAPQGRHPLKIW